MFIGNSHAYCTFIPKIVEDKTSKTAYNAAMPSQVLDLAWYNLEYMLQRQSPEIIVLEAFAFQKPSERDVFNDSNIDSMRFGKTKLTAIFDIYKSFTNRMELLFKIYRHHGNWTKFELVKENFLSVVNNIEIPNGYIESKGFYDLDSVMSSETSDKYKNMKDASYVAKVTDYNEKLMNVKAEE